MYDSDVLVQSVTFHPDGAFDIVFAEQRDVTARGTTVKNAMFPAGILPEPRIQEVLDSIRELLDLALEAQRDEPSTRLSRR